MGDYSNLVNAKEETIKSQRNIIQWMAGFVALLIVALIMMPRMITLYYPPDLSTSTEMKIGDIPETSVYGFAYTVFQQLNRWPHGYAVGYDAESDDIHWFSTPWPDEKKAWLKGRERFGRIAFANSDAAASAMTESAIEQGYRATQEILDEQ